MTTQDPSLPFDLRRVSAYVGFISSLLGVGVGAHLTVFKFKMVYTPCLSPTEGCKLGHLTCGAALESSVSMLLKLPISLWGSAFYLATTVLTASLLFRRDPFQGTAAHVLLLFAGLGVCVSLTLAAYTAFLLPSLCSYCLTLYAISGLLLWSALTLQRPVNSHPTSYREFLHKHPAEVVHCMFVALLVFVCSIGVQSFAYHSLRNRFDAQIGCPEPKEPLPHASIKFGSKDPAAIVAISSTCRATLVAASSASSPPPSAPASFLSQSNCGSITHHAMPATPTRSLRAITRP
jgi:uncharacterized membrane protein